MALILCLQDAVQVVVYDQISLHRTYPIWTLGTLMSLDQLSIRLWILEFPKVLPRKLDRGLVAASRTVHCGEETFACNRK